MRNTIPLLLLLFVTVTLVAFRAEQKEAKGFVLTGKIKGLSYPYIYLAHRENGVDKIDSCLLKDGAFQFKGMVAEPEMAFLHTKDRRLQKVFYAENVVMKVEGDISALDNVVVKGSKTQDEQMIFEERINSHRAKVIALFNKVEALKKVGDTVQMKVVQTEADKLYRYESEIRKQFILDYPGSTVSLYELLNWANESNYKEARIMFSRLDPAVQNLAKSQEVLTRFANLESVELGKPFIDFTQFDSNGNAVSLSSYKGKYVLLEFWASWCGPCRAENPNLRAAYLKYKDKGFNILGVSLDEDANKWKKAMEKDDLPWAQISDLKGWRNEAAVQYGVRSIPANFLIDPQGKIVKRDLRGEELNKALLELFGN
jgi:peroxiredoxin